MFVGECGAGATRLQQLAAARRRRALLELFPVLVVLIIDVFILSLRLLLLLEIFHESRTVIISVGVGVVVANWILLIAAALVGRR